MFRLAKKDYREVSHIEAYDACMDLASLTPYPSIGVVKFKLGALTLTAMVFFIAKFFEEAAGALIYVVPVLLASSFSPTYMPFIAHRWRGAKDSLLTEHRSLKLRLSYLRNFYDD